MAEEVSKKGESKAPSETPPAPAPALALAPAPAESPKDVAEEKSVIPPPLPPPEEKPDASKAVVLAEKAPEPLEKKSSEGSINRDAVLAKVATEKKLSLIRAWEESEKSKAENKAQKKISSVGAWENSEKANVEAELKKWRRSWRNRRQNILRK